MRLHVLRVVQHKPMDEFLELWCHHTDSVGAFQYFVIHCRVLLIIPGTLCCRSIF